MSQNWYYVDPCHIHASYDEAIKKEINSDLWLSLINGSGSSSWYIKLEGRFEALWGGGGK